MTGNVMHVLQVTPWYKPHVGGVVNSVVTLSEHLCREGYCCTVLIHDDSSRARLIDRDGAISVYGMRLRSFFCRRHPVRAILAWLATFPATVLRLRNFIRRQNIGLVEVHFPNAWSLYFPVLRWLFGIPYIVRVHGSDVHVLMHEHWTVERAVIATISRAGALVACSQRLLLETRKKIRKLPEIAEAVYVGVLPEWAARGRETPVELGDRRYIVANGFPVNVKGSDILVSAFARVADRYPDVDLVLVGSRDDQHHLTGLIDALGLAHRVKLLGAVPHNELPAVFANALFGVVPSRREAFGQVTLEFQLLQKAVIGSNVGGLPEAISDGYSGFLVPPEDIDALAERIEFCLENPQVCRELGRNGHDRVMREFTVARTGRRSIQLYHWAASH